MPYIDHDDNRPHLVTSLLLIVPAALLFVTDAEARSLTASSWVAHSVASQLEAATTRDLEGWKPSPDAAPKQRVRRHRRGFAQLTDSPGLKVRKPERAWGTELALARIKEVAAVYQQRFADAPPLEIHDLSTRWGGKLKPHVSHRRGRDVDIRVVLNRPTRRYVNATPRNLHLERMWFLLQQFSNSCDVEFIFLDRSLQRVLYRHARAQGVSRAELANLFQYPFRRLSGIVRHSRGHKNHIHVRFRHAGQRRMQYSAAAHCATKRKDISDEQLLSLL